MSALIIAIWCLAVVSLIAYAVNRGRKRPAVSSGSTDELVDEGFEVAFAGEERASYEVLFDRELKSGRFRIVTIRDGNSVRHILQPKSFSGSPGSAKGKRQDGPIRSRPVG